MPFWSAEANDCLIPGCLDVTMLVPGAEGVGGYVARTIDYVYDPLNRLTEANYDDETYFHYVYDPVGNRLSEETQIGATSYAYDVANRLLSVAGQAYTWDANGNLLSDGTSAYTYDKANRLVAVQQNGASYAFAYNGTGDRVGQAVDGVTTNYTLDLAAGLTQVLADGTNAYLYGLGRVGEQGAEWQYHLGDALGSVRQLAGADGSVSFAQSYAPYGSVLSIGGGGATTYGFTGEWTDDTGLVHLRARYLDAGVGRFVSRDEFEGDHNRPISLHRWIYVNSNPVLLTDPSGYAPIVYCSKIQFPDLKDLCIQSNGPDDDLKTIDARWKFFKRLSFYSISYGSIFGEGYVWAGRMLERFLSGETSKFEVQLPSGTSLARDHGIIRATKLNLPKIAGDEPDEITPLLYIFLKQAIMPQLECNSFTFPNSVAVFSDQSWEGRYSPRPIDRGWWGAFGHIPIDATYTNTWAINLSAFRKYYLSTMVEYHVEDKYGWFPGKSTPFGPPVASETIYIPHEWELSLVKAGRAYMFDFSVTWVEKLELLIPESLDSFTIIGQGINGSLDD